MKAIFDFEAGQLKILPENAKEKQQLGKIFEGNFILKHAGMTVVGKEVKELCFDIYVRKEGSY